MADPRLLSDRSFDQCLEDITGDARRALPAGYALRDDRAARIEDADALRQRIADLERVGAQMAEALAKLGELIDLAYDTGYLAGCAYAIALYDSQRPGLGTVDEAEQRALIAKRNALQAEMFRSVLEWETVKP